MDLIYLDPPFNSNANYNILFGNAGARKNGDTQIIAFQDTWHWNDAAIRRVDALKRASTQLGQFIRGLDTILGESGMLAYISYMAERLRECQRLLKTSGSIYLHCDPTAGHYLKLLMDAIFGGGNFITEIIWNYGTPSGGRASGKKPVKSFEILLVYAAHYGKHLYNRQYTPYSKKYVTNWFRHTDEVGRKYRTRTRGGKIIRQYLDESPGVPLSNTWTDIMQLYGSSGWFPANRKEQLGYPTQKPLALLNRIISASSNPGDIVLDPFCGCGTTVVAAEELGRRFIGIDIASFALDLIRERRLSKSEITIIGTPLRMPDAVKMAAERPFDFEKWAIERIKGLLSNQVQVGDGGIDGRGRLANSMDDSDLDLVLAQVKGGKFNLNDLRAFRGVMASAEAAFGIFITLHKLKDRQWDNAKAFAASVGTLGQGVNEYPRMQIWSIEEYFDGRRPELPSLAHPVTGKPLEGPLI